MSDDSKVAAGRFSLYVPEPKARLNLGKPEEGANAFGHPGISLQAENSLYVSVGSVVHVQAEKDVHFEATRHFEQFAQKNMNLAARQNASFAADGKLLLAAGAVQGATPTIAYSKQDPTWIDYNNLRLHHIVDSVSARLKELFYGEDWKELQAKAKGDQKDWFTGDKPHTTKGMLYDLHDHLMQLGLDKATDKEAIAALLEPMTWSPDYVSAIGKKLPWNWGSSEFKWAVASDPYAPSPVSGDGFYRVVTKSMAYLLQTGILLRRLSDALEALIPAIMEFEVIARIRGLVQATKAMNEAIIAMDPKKWSQ
ncbi:MAG: hypothetical protein FJ096_16810 [Deltaproteobacteria bacterium]|nr:hypothetical protein [Deltaproteobacteria bacterium]